MKRLNLFIVAGVFALVLAGCADFLTRAKQSRDAAQVTLNATTQAVSELKTELAALPPDAPDRQKILDAIAKGEKIIADGQKAVDTATAAIKAVENGQIDQSLTGALGAVPYGGYIVTALSLGLWLYKSYKANNIQDALTKVVHSWEAVGAPLTEQQKTQVASIQGSDVTALVHEIKEKLGATPAASPDPSAAAATLTSSAQASEIFPQAVEDK